MNTADLRLKFPGAVFGDNTYGDPVVHGGYWALEVGKFCSLAYRTNFQLGGGHSLDKVSTYPFAALDKWKDKTTSWVDQPSERGIGIKVGNDVWTGLNCSIRAGTTIGDGAVIGMGAIVLDDVPPYAIVVGNPARILRYRFDDKIIRDLLLIKWWDLKDDIIQELLPLMDDPKKFIKYYEDNPNQFRPENYRR